MPELDQQAGGTPPSGFTHDMQELRDLMERFAQPPRRFSSEAHPHFGHLTGTEWMRLAYLHSDHHLRQFGA